MKKIIEWFNRPYPGIETNQERFSLAFVLGAMVSLALFVFQPFGLREIHQIKILSILGFGALTSSVTIISLYILHMLRITKVMKGQWCVGKQIVFMHVLLIFITVGNWWLDTTISAAVSTPSHSLSDFLLITFIVGIFPLLASIIFSEKILRKRNDMTASDLNREITSTASTSPDLPVPCDSFIYAKAEGNYLQIFNLQGEPQLLRKTMRELESLYQNELSIIRCHRSYMVNTHSISSVKGNASGLILRHKDGTNIPVSRTFVEDVRRSFLVAR